MADIITKFGQHIDNTISKNPDAARKELLLGYKAFNLKMKYAPDKRLSPARKYLAKICMDVHIRSFSDAENSALISVFLPCEIIRAFVTNPTGSLRTFSSDFSDADTETYNGYSAMELYIE